MFQRIAVVNRGEPAMRLIRAVRELNEEHGYGIRVIAMHTEDERSATFVRAADESVVLRDTGRGIPYLDHEELGRALRAGIDWPTSRARGCSDKHISSTIGRARAS